MKKKLNDAPSIAPKLAQSDAAVKNSGAVAEKEVSPPVSDLAECGAYREQSAEPLDKANAKEQSAAQTGDVNETVIAALRDLLWDERFVRQFVAPHPQVRAAVITAYLTERTRSAPVPAGGGAALAPVRRAKTLEQAKDLCESFLKNI